MKKVFVLSVQPDPEGPTFGRVMDPNDFQKSQDFAHHHIDQVVKDLLVAGAPGAQVAGFQATVAGGLNVSVATGTAVDALGLSYETQDDPTVVAMAPAHIGLPRIDLIYASLEIDAQADSEFRPYRQLRTQAELEAGVPPYTPTQFNQPTELHTRASIAVKTGVAAAVPAPPGVGANEVALWQVHVAAGQLVLVANDLTSVRVLMKSLYSTIQDVLVMQAILAAATSLNTPLTLVKRDAAGGFKGSGLVEVFGATELLEGQSQTVFSVRPHPNGSFSNSPMFSVRAMGGPTPDGVKRSGARIEIVGDLFGNNPITTFDYWTVSSGSRGLWQMANGHKWHATSLVAGADGRAFVYRSIDQGGSGGPNALLVGQDPGGADKFYVLMDGSIKTFGNLEVVGNLSKGSGTFLIDHPLHPDTKDLVHAFIEAPRDELIYRGTAVLPNGQTQVQVDIDAASGMESGTFAALTQNTEVWIQNQTGFARARGTIAEGTLTIIAEAASEDTFSWLVIAERNDSYIRAAEGRDANGHLIVERSKPPLPADAQELLGDATELRQAEDAAPDVVEEQIVAELVGKAGYPRHAEIIGAGAKPTREVTIVTTDMEGNPYEAP